jgi:hypothetical protein
MIFDKTGNNSFYNLNIVEAWDKVVDTIKAIEKSTWIKATPDG